MSNQVAVVTGAGSGIGRAIATELAARGLTVVATDRDLAAARVTAEKFGGEARHLDVTDPAEASQVAEEIAAGHGGIGVWVSNAGISKMQRFLDVSQADLRQTLAVNLEGVFTCGQAAARVMIGRGIAGTIVNVASMAGKQGRVPYLADYVASKFGVVGLTQAMAFELAPHNITVNSVCPGYVATPMQDRELGWEAELRGAAPEHVKQLWIDDTPLGRLETPVDVARAVAFLAGPDARFITGEALAVNGGAFMDLLCSGHYPRCDTITDMDLLADLEARGLVQDSTDRDALRDRIAAGPVGIYYGCDPSADSLQVGNLVGLLALRRFADAGHNAIALAGGATGMIGDPGGRSKERNLLDAETLAHNTKRIAEQLERISRVPLVNNLGWTGSLTLLDFLRDVGKHASVNQMIARESVKARLESENGISYTEFSYQLLQANDYLHLLRKHGVEIQIGGSDQWGNLLAGVDLIRKADGQHVHAFTWPLLLRSDGKKFGKSEDGAVWLAADRTSPYQFFQYWMNVTDADVERFLLQLTLLPVEECRAAAAAHAQAPNKREGQRRLAREVTTIVHGAAATAAAEEASAILFGGSPAGASEQALSFLASEVPTSPFVSGDDLAHALARTPLASSLSDARRTIAQGAAYVNGEVVREDRPLSEADLLYDRWLLLRKGKRTYHLLDAASR